MVLRLKIRKDNLQNRIFLRREWPWVAIICALITYGNYVESAPVLLAAAVVIAITILRSDVSNAFYWALFLVPNIRMLDLVGVTFLVNLLMAVPLIGYLFKSGMKRLSAVAVLGGIALLVMEFIHDAWLNDLENVVNIGGWILNFMLCVMITTDARIKISKNDVFSALSTGIIMSAVMYLLVSGESVLHIVETLESNTRLEAFANDPNAYSMYTALAIACLINVRGHSIYKFGTLLVLVGIGLLTASKMGLITIVVELVLIFLQIFTRNRENKAIRRFAGWALAGIAGMAIILRDYVEIIVRNFVRRAGSEDLQELNMNRFTTGRWGLVMDYFEILGTDAICLLFGYGFAYHKHVGAFGMNVSHNTYLDLVLTWGILGTGIFLFILYMWIRSFLRARQIRKIGLAQYIPLITLLITFMALSCLSASMFPFVLAVAFIQWLPYNDLQTGS